MALPELKKLYTDNPDLNKIQGYIKDQFSLLNADFIRGRFLTEVSNGIETDLVSIPTSDKVFQHKLGRNIVGFIVLDLRTNAVIWRSSTSSPETNLVLRASAAATARIWVF
jgi:hypothetical protein